MRTEERFEYRGYVIDVFANHHESGQWTSSYLILKNGNQVSSPTSSSLQSYASVLVAQNHAIEEGRKAIDALIGKER